MKYEQYITYTGNKLSLYTSGMDITTEFIYHAFFFGKYSTKQCRQYKKNCGLGNTLQVNTHIYDFFYARGMKKNGESLISLAVLQ